jgi:ketosteroid isomerase-like protein
VVRADLQLFPDIRFEVLVRGSPWRTRAVALVKVRATVEGTVYRNELAQTIDIRFGRIVRINTLEDTQKLAGALGRLAELGVEEAAAPAIEDPVPAAV